MDIPASYVRKYQRVNIIDSKTFCNQKRFLCVFPTPLVTSALQEVDLGSSDLNLLSCDQGDLLQFLPDPHPGTLPEVPVSFGPQKHTNQTPFTSGGMTGCLRFLEK